MEYLCNNCPRMCNIMRSETGNGVCRMGADAVVSRAAPHFDEEPVISGTRGSGAIFFAGCAFVAAFARITAFPTAVSGGASAWKDSSIFMRI